MSSSEKYVYCGASEIYNGNYLGNYLVCDYGGNRIVELTPDYSMIMVRQYSINGPVFLDYL